MIIMPFKPQFIGFPDEPGTYHAVLDMPDRDENGDMRIPFIFDPSGKSPYTVTVGVDK